MSATTNGTDSTSVEDVDAFVFEITTRLASTSVTHDDEEDEDEDYSALGITNNTATSITDATSPAATTPLGRAYATAEQLESLLEQYESAFAGVAPIRMANHRVRAMLFPPLSAFVAATENAAHAYADLVRIYLSVRPDGSAEAAADAAEAAATGAADAFLSRAELARRIVEADLADEDGGDEEEGEGGGSGRYDVDEGVDVDEGADVDVDEEDDGRGWVLDKETFVPAWQFMLDVLVDVFNT